MEMSDREETRSQVRRIPLGELSFQPRFAYGEQAEIAEVTGTGDGTTLGTGFARFTNAEIPWAIQYDEVLLVIEGQVTVRTKEGDFTLGPRDSLWLPKGTELIYCSDSALVFYAIHPSNWAEENA
jgi:ethanolamine utilization protein EutQ